MRFGDGDRRDLQGLSKDDSFESKEDECRDCLDAISRDQRQTPAASS